jgi:hypothetical protein
MTEPNIAQTSTWRPDPDTTSHTGSAISTDADFFVAPPANIGELVSAATTLPISTYPMNPIIRWGLVVGSGAALAAVIQMITATALLSLMMGVILSGTVWFYTKFQHFCSYVGTAGVVKYELFGSRSAIPKENSLLFTDAHSLYTSSTRNYYNGIYTGTNYSYRWMKNSGGQYVISGNHRSEQGSPPEKNLWHFANVAESVWTNHVLNGMAEQFERYGYVEFPLTGSLQAVRVGEGFMEFVTKKDGAQRVMVDDMRDILLGSGTFQFKHQDSRWWSGKGKYSFQYSTIPNADAFLICLKQFAGISWS